VAGTLPRSLPQPQANGAIGFYPAAPAHGVPSTQAKPAQAAALSESGSAAVPWNWGFSLRLKNNEISPSNPECRILITLDQAGSGRVSLYRADGALVLTLADEPRPSGPWVLSWRGQQSDGSPAPSGVYTLVLQVPGHLEKRNIAVVR
jgi:hypothetical protein